jgi:hypothetical protein
VLEVKDLDKVTMVMNAIVDQDRGMDQLADTDPSLDELPMYGKVPRSST